MPGWLGRHPVDRRAALPPSSRTCTLAKRRVAGKQPCDSPWLNDKFVEEAIIRRKQPPYLRENTIHQLAQRLSPN